MKFTILNRILIQLLCLTFQTITAYAQNVDVAIHSKLGTYKALNYSEKVFLHTDRESYLAGEILWFKAYIINGNSNKPSHLSKIVYVEIIDQHRQSILQTKIPIKNGSGDGSIFIPQITASGNYTIRAYTAWMKNFDATHYFQKDLRILNPFHTAAATTRGSARKADIQFFPEGGNLVGGLKSKIAFRATDQFGKGLNFTGTLVNSKNVLVAKFEPLKFGIGNFLFTPELNERYQAKLKFPDGSEYTKEFITATESGFAMQAEINEKEIHLTIRSKGQQDQQLYLVAHTRAEVKSTLAGQLKNGEFTCSISQNILGDGISHFTIFNAAMQPVCERLYFKKKPQQKLILEANLKQPQYNSREKVHLNTSASNENGVPMAADISIAVVRADSSEFSNTVDINSYLWLSSELKGKVDSMQYYFNTDTEETKLATDNLMLTHGWRRFRWRDVIQETQATFKFEPEHNTKLITATIIDKQTKNPAGNVEAYLSVVGKNQHLYIDKSDDQGQVSFHTKDIFGTEILSLQTRSASDNNYLIKLNNEFSTDYPTLETSPATSNYSKERLTDWNLSMQVQNIYHADRLKQFEVPYTDTSAFYGNASDRMYVLKKYTLFPNMEDVFREFVPEVFIKKRDGRFSLSTYNVAEKYYVEEPPLILLDGVPIFDQDKIMQHNALKIKSIDLVTKKYFLNASTFGGIINFSSYKNNLEGFRLDPGTVLIDYEGLQAKREFYSPVYDSPADKTSRLPDFRELLFWSANEKTDESGKATQSFYTSDLPGKYLIIVQGLSDDGRAGYSTSFFEVKSNYK